MSAVAAKTAVTPTRRSWWKRGQNTRTAYLFLLPAMLVMAVITFYPLVFQVLMSFTDYSLGNFRGKPPTIVQVFDRTAAIILDRTSFETWSMPGL